MIATDTAPARKTGSVINPATGRVVAEVPYANVEDVDRVVRTAHAAFLAWRDVPVVDRPRSVSAGNTSRPRT